MSSEPASAKPAESPNIMGIPILWYLAILAIVMLGSCAGVIPNNFLTGFTFCLVIGALLEWVGTRNRTIHLAGGPSLLCIFVPTILLYFGILPQKLIASTTVFYTGTMGFIDCFVATLICGSILSMNRDILIKAGSRYAVPLFIGITFSFVGGGLVGALTGYGFKEAIASLSIPIMSGGIGAGALPISQIYGQIKGITDTGVMLSLIMPAITLANLFSILTGSLLNVLGKKPDRFFKGFSGNGDMMRTGEVFEAREEDKPKSGTFVDMTVGILMAGSLYILGHIISKFVYSGVHPYAWTIIMTTILKISGIIPRRLEKCAEVWYSFVAYAGTSTILVALSVTAIDIKIILEALSNPSYLIITLAVTWLAALGAGIGGIIMKMNFVESAITAGLCMSNVGGAGDVAVLGASDRMHLMPFAQISSRIGGAIILLLASILAPFLLQ